MIYTHFVKDDLKEINGWYNKIDNKLWNNFVKEFRSKISFIKRNPLSLEQKYGNNRVAFLNKFPYGIHYLYDESKNTVMYIPFFTHPEILRIWRAENKSPNLKIKIRVFIVNSYGVL